MIRLQFVRGSGLSSAAIAWFSQGHLSHVDAVMPDGSLLGARSDAIGGKPPGVQIRPAGYEKWALRLIYALPATARQEETFYDFLLAQVGKPYDKLAIVAFALNRDWRDDRAWYCAELDARALELAGLSRPGYLDANKITPVMLAELVSEIGGSLVLSAA